MKLAFTADLHLKKRKDSPARYRALENILDSLKKEKIKELIISGDIFDKEDSGLRDLEKLCIKNSGINFHIIPGNHDPLLSTGKMFGDNIYIYASPSVRRMGPIQLMLLPYNPEKSMGESIQEAAGLIKEEKPLYITGHGDWLGGATEPNPLEKGTYMPLTRADINRYRPVKVILGHIHKPFDGRRVFYPGSPFPLHINETGKRRFLVLDTAKEKISPVAVETEKLYFKEEIFILPLENEAEEIKKRCRAIIKGWNLNKEEKKKAVIKINLRGYSSNREEAVSAVEKEFSSFSFYTGSPSRDELAHLGSGGDIRDLIKNTLDYIDSELKWDFSSPRSPSREEVIMKALEKVCG